MARYYTEISKEDFISHVKHMMSNEDGELSYSWAYEDDRISKIILKDISKVLFDFENCTGFEDNESTYLDGYLVEYHELSPGFHTFWVSAGGDWEIPVNFLLYWGDNRLRGYIPKDGNVWNKKYKTAYGSEHDSDSFDWVKYPDGMDFNDIDFEKIEKSADSQKMIDEVLVHITKHPKNDEYVLKQPKVPTSPTKTKETQVKQSLPKEYYEHEITVLEHRLQLAVRSENYELAVQLRDEITLIKTTHNI